MTKEPKPTLEQVKASIRDALRKLTGDFEPGPLVELVTIKRKRPLADKPKDASD